MSRHDYAVLTLRGFALYAWFTAIQYFTSGIFELWYAMTSDMMSKSVVSGYGYFAIAVLIPPALYAAIGLFLFMRSHVLASWLMPAPEETAAQLPPHPLPAASVAFAGVGVAMFLHALPGMLSQCIELVNAYDSVARASLLRKYESQLIGEAAEIILAFVLFLKARVFATVWWRKQEHEAGG